MKTNNYSRTGIFISFEGNDGCGKSSTIKAVADFLKNQGYKVLLTREPGGANAPVAEKIRDLILDPEDKMEPMTEALLYAASRSEHVKKTILPALLDGYIVISDRYVGSSLVYQGVARHLGVDTVYSINEYAMQGVEPDLTLNIMVDPNICFERINKSGRKLDRLEQEKIAFHETVYCGYEALSDGHLISSDTKFVRINGEQTPENVANDAIKAVMKFLEKKKF